ncbi:MAG: hypothetical protein Q4B05_03120 [Candidatus Saccharibacteria bacterium]|nr:hypothetical protein [Candidatus Saccharibacteria bacterium]
MNPELPRVQPSLEQSPVVGGELVESAGSQILERERAGRYETAPIPASDSTQELPVALPSIAPPPIASPPTDTVTPADPVGTSLPLLAADDDLIEKEWVEKLKKIISLTKEDPYERARVIAQIQADYLKKRLNRSLGQADE